MDDVMAIFANFLILPMCLIAFSLLFCGVLSFVIYRVCKKKWASILPFCLIPLCIIVLISLMFDSLPYIEMLPKDKDAEQLYDVAQVTEVRNAMACPMYYDVSTGDFSVVKLVVTNRGSFLGLDCDGIQQGDYLQLRFLPYSRLIMEIKHTTDTEAEEYWRTNPIPGTNLTEGQVKPEEGNAASLVSIMFVFFLAQGVAGDVFKWEIIDRLRQRDQMVDRVMPRAYGTIHIMINILFFLIMICVAIALKIYNMAAFLVFAFAGAVWYLLQRLNIRLTYDETVICCRRLTGSVSYIPFESIQRIYWKDQARVMGCTLIIEAEGVPVLYLPEANYVGLRALYRLSQEKTQDVDENRGQGDGLREP